MRRQQPIRFFCSSTNDVDADDARKPTTAGTTSMMTVRQAWKSSLEQLKERGVSEPDWSVAHLLSNVLDLPWSNGFSQLQRAMTENVDDNDNLADRQLTKMQQQEYQSMIQRRLDNEPLQYILGKWDFMDYEELIIRPPLLCPRPETEELVELVCRHIKTTTTTTTTKKQQPLNILDVGAGTGVIGIALADKVPSASITAIDIESVAIETSMENAKLILGRNNDKRYKALECSAQDYQTEKPVDVLVSNPPYIPRSDMRTLSEDVIRYESEDALFGGGDDGMDIIRTIVRKWATEWGTPTSSTCWMEVDPTHPSLLEVWLDQPEQREGLGVYLESTYQDLSGRDRFVKLAFRTDHEE